MSGWEDAVARVANRVRLAVGRCVLLAVGDAPKLQSLQIELLAGEVRDRAERFQEYGFTSHPHPGAEGIAVAIGGSRDHMVVIKVDDRRYRMTALQAGEVAVYTDEGDYILFKRGREIEVRAGTKVTVDAPLAHFTGDVTIAGRLDVTGDVTGEGKSLPHHTHTEQGDGAPTSPPN